MKENLAENPANRSELRKIVLEKILMGMEERKSPEINRLATVLHGPHAHKGLMVIGRKEDGSVLALPSPESETPIELGPDEVWHYDDYEDAYRKSLETYPFTAEELGTKWPDSMGN